MDRTEAFDEIDCCLARCMYDDWDEGEDGLPVKRITPETWLNARKMIEFKPEDCPFPDRIQPSLEGEILFYWFADRGDWPDNVIAYISHDRTVTWGSTTGRGKESKTTSGVCKIGNGFPTEIEQQLKCVMDASLTKGTV